MHDTKCKYQSKEALRGLENSEQASSTRATDPVLKLDDLCGSLRTVIKKQIKEIDCSLIGE